MLLVEIELVTTWPRGKAGMGLSITILLFFFPQSKVQSSEEKKNEGYDWYVD